MTCSCISRHISWRIISRTLELIQKPGNQKDFGEDHTVRGLEVRELRARKLEYLALICAPALLENNKGVRRFAPAANLLAESIDCESQKSPLKPRPAKMKRISSGCGRREFSSKRVEYQVVASVQSWSIVTSGRMG